MTTHFLAHRWPRRPSNNNSDERLGTGGSIAVMFPQSRTERSALQREFGPGTLVDDGRLVADPNVVLVTPCSRQTMARLRSDYPKALIVVVDAREPVLPLAMNGWAQHRMLATGADVYATDLANVADLLARRHARGAQAVEPVEAPRLDVSA